MVVRGERRAMYTEPSGCHDVNAFLDVFELAVKSSDQINRACITERLHFDWGGVDTVGQRKTATAVRSRTKPISQTHPHPPSAFLNFSPNATGGEFWCRKNHRFV